MKMGRFVAICALSVFCGLSVFPAFGQVATGTPPFGSFGGGPDIIDLANLNAEIVIPVFQKPGRGLPFIYNLTYNSSVWSAVGSSGSQLWQPVGNFGWNGPSGTGYVSTHLGTLTNCIENNRPVPAYWTYTNFVYVDGYGTSHTFAGTDTFGEGGLCGFAFGWDTFSAIATDGSGYTLSMIGGASGMTVTGRRGSVIQLSGLGYQLLSGGSMDSNGNEITLGSSGVFTDTLGQTALTIAGSGTPTSPTTFTYAAPSTASASYTMNYTSYTVATNFGVSGISEYGATAVPLVSSIVLPDGTRYTFTYEPTPSTPSSGACTPISGTYATNCVTGRIASIELPTEGTISYKYSGGNNGILSDGSTAGLKRTTPDGTWIYARSGSGTAWTTTITDPSTPSNQTVINFQSVIPVAGGPAFFFETERQVYQGSTSGTLLKTTFTCYNGGTPNCNATAITLPITQRSHYLQWPGGLESVTHKTYNTYGSVTENDQYAYGSGAPGSIARKTLTTYASLGNGIVSMPASVTVEDGSGNIKSQTTYTYDQGNVTATSGTPQHVAISGSRGNATTISYLVSGSTSLGKTFTYYDTGNVNVAADVNGAQTTYSYGTGSCGNSFVTSVSEPLSLSRSLTWNCTGGVETSVTDENGHTVSSNYTSDLDFWRPNSTSDQESNTTNFTYTGQTSVESFLDFNGTTSTTDILSTVDPLGRTHVSQVKESPSSSTYDSVESDYDSLGRPDRTTLPYAGAAGATSSSAPSKNTTYDALGRKLTFTDSGGRDVTFSYSQNDSSRTLGPAPTGENTKRKQFEYDALHRLTSVCEITSLTGSGTCGQTNAATGYWSQYAYDALNHLTGVTQNAQASQKQTRAYLYDDLGRLISESNPESGTTAYVYDTDATCGTSKGDLVKKTDQVGNTICYAYDASHRVISVTYPSGSYSSVTPSKHFVYDAATVNSIAMTNVKGRLAEAYTCTSCPSKLTDLGISYTARGEASDLYESTPNSGAYNHVSQTYWANGAPDALSAQHGASSITGLPTITYGVDGEGRTYSASASSGQNPLSSTTYSVASLPTQVNLGSSDSDAFTYDPNTNRMTKYQFNVNGQSVKGTLTWNDIGTLEGLAIVDPLYGPGNQSCAYTHDDLSRIATANCGSPWSQTITYDSFGNLNKSGTSSFQPTYSPSTNRMTEIGSSTPTYDANGNVTNDFLHTYAWDANGRPVTIDGVSVTYDAFGRIVERSNGAYTQIVYTPSGAKLAILSGSTLQKAFVPLPGGSAAVYNSSGLAYYRHSDWLGTSRFASTPARALYYDGAYGPFGELYAQTGTTDVSFTGMNQDTVANLYDFPAREYGTQGRWPSPDPAGLSSVRFRDPQTLNRYAYVRNNPLAATDATGLECTDDGACGDDGDGADGGVDDDGYGVYGHAVLFNGGGVGGGSDSGDGGVDSGDPGDDPGGPSGADPSDPGDGGDSGGVGSGQAGNPCTGGDPSGSVASPGETGGQCAGGPDGPNQQPPPPPTQSQYSKSYTDFVACEIDQDIANVDQTVGAKNAFVVANSAPFVFASSGNVPATVASLVLAGIFDLGYILENRETCAQTVYGPGYF